MVTFETPEEARDRILEDASKRAVRIPQANLDLHEYISAEAKADAAYINGVPSEG